MFHKELMTTRYFAMALSAASMIGSIGYVGLALSALVDVCFVSPLVGSNDLTWAAVLALFVGCITFVLTPVGFYSLLTGHTSLMFLYSCLTLFLAFIALLSGYFGNDMRFDTTNPSFVPWIIETQMEEYGNPHNDDVTLAWDRAQQQFHCCGVHDSVDQQKEWINSTWFKSQTQYPPPRNPSSCCTTCETVHEKYCTAFLTTPIVEGKNMTLEQKVCLQASDSCTAADSNYSDLNVCVGIEVSAFQWPRDATIHTVGCAVPIATSVSYYGLSFLKFGIIISLLLFLSFATWLRIAYKLSQENGEYSNVLIK